ncbi:MAG: TIGR03617 family F420-dependent LLM class oxidoreductase [Streptosporangiales bacterium]|nr:TIGR03617 family F420-dependent LLM class oxidoreductase [Streptosporangiales bacterium]
MTAPLRVDARLRPASLSDTVTAVRELEAVGFSGIWTTETTDDPFLPLVLAAEHSHRVRIGTSIAVAFARTPMTVAYQAATLARYSGGRFTLGLGTQIKPHIERRFAMPWSRPAARMEEYVRALREIWRCWRTGDRLRFSGEFYSHTLMTPAFTPSLADADPPVVLAAVGERMIRVAGEVADGLLVHSLNSPDYLRSVILPGYETALTGAGRSRADVEIGAGVMIATGETEEAMATAVRALKERIAFYASTPAYRGVLEQHGLGALADELHSLSVGRDPERWTRMGELIDDDVMHTYGVAAEPDRLAEAVRTRMSGLVDRVALTPIAATPPHLIARAAAEITGAG